MKRYLVMFKAIGTMWNREVDKFEEGCIPDTMVSGSNKITFTGNTLTEMFENIRQGLMVDMDNISIDTDLHMGQIIVTRHETNNGGIPNEATINKWKKGKYTLWAADYFFKVVESNDVDFSKIEIDEIKKWGVSY